MLLRDQVIICLAFPSLIIVTLRLRVVTAFGRSAGPCCTSEHLFRIFHALHAPFTLAAVLCFTQSYTASLLQSSKVEGAPSLYPRRLQTYHTSPAHKVCSRSGRKDETLERGKPSYDPGVLTKPYSSVAVDTPQDSPSGTPRKGSPRIDR